MNCIFCKIINKEAGAEIIYENENLISFLDIRPLNYGHTLVIPKQHYENFLDVPAELLSELTSVTQLISSAIKASLNPDGFNIIANNGVAAGQSVFHFHFHIIPRYLDDGMKPALNLKKYSNGSMLEYAEKIQSAVKKIEGKING